MIKRGVAKCSGCGREMHIPVHASQAKIEAEMERAGTEIHCARCTTTAKEGAQYPSEAK